MGFPHKITQRFLRGIIAALVVANLVYIALIGATLVKVARNVERF